MRKRRWGGGLEELVRMEIDEEGVQMEREKMGGGCGQSDKERQDYECHPFCPSLSEQPAATTRTLRRFPLFFPLERIPQLILHLTPMLLAGRPRSASSRNYRDFRHVLPK